MLLRCQLLLLIDDALMDDCVYLIKSRSRIVRQEDLLLTNDPLLLLLTQIHHLLLLNEPLSDLFVRPWLL